MTEHLHEKRETGQGNTGAPAANAAGRKKGTSGNAGWATWSRPAHAHLPSEPRVLPTASAGPDANDKAVKRAVAAEELGLPKQTDGERMAWGWRQAQWGPATRALSK